jgi:cyclohexanone monooxygenase
LIVCASGFELFTDYWGRLGFDPVGAGGIPMSTAWKHGAETLHGVHVRGFPNLLLNQVSQGGASVNFAYTIHEASRHIAHNIARCLADGSTRVEPTRLATYNWLRLIVASAWRITPYTLNCTPGSYNFEGQPPKEVRAALRILPYVGNATTWAGMLEAWRAEGSMRGLKRERR